MPISLVPEAAPANDAHEVSDVTEEQARAYLLALRGEKLDVLREHIPRLRTSELVAMLSDKNVVFSIVMEGQDQLRDGQLVMAALLSIANELDRRVPIPT